ncbi:hypothetical protein JB92DRAFT_3099353 [Gautieria morchelliformis]|nr:hypothetical protein JB92DRAFT_3099353 [Gautieria morchelliformis]
MTVAHKYLPMDSVLTGVDKAERTPVDFVTVPSGMQATGGRSGASRSFAWLPEIRCHRGIASIRNISWEIGNKQERNGSCVTETVKDQLSARGWCQSGIEELERRIREIPTFTVTVHPTRLKTFKGGLGETRETGLLAAIRLRPGGDGSALWQMRCFDATLKGQLRRIFDDS